MVGFLDLRTYGLDISEIMLRVVIACMIGIAFGFERKHKGKAAGLKTNMLICAGSAVVAIIQVVIYEKVVQTTGENMVVKADITRLTAQVISGLGFLGAGVIMRGGDKVRGLTTAATMWLVAVLGVGIGYGLYYIIVPVTIIIIVFAYITKEAERRYLDHRVVKKIAIEYIENSNVEELINDIIEEKNIKVMSDKKIWERVDGKKVIVRKIVQYSVPKYANYRYFITLLENFDDIMSVTTIN